jgi:hydrogenase-4 component B
MDIADMSLISIFVLSLVVSVCGAVVSIVLKRFDNAARVGAALFGIVAAVLGVIAGLMMIFVPPANILVVSGPFLLANFSLQLNPLAGLLVTVISVLAVVSWIYSLSYVKEYKGKAGTIGFFMNLFIPAMSLVITADNALWFIVFFEIMSLTSYFLVITDQDTKAVKAGLIYLIMSHGGLVLVMLAFFIMASQSGSLDFSSFRTLEMSPVLASVVFLLTFVGFGIKAGLVPFHSWLPLAHPSAPSHVSALMSGGMIKIGIFGIIKVVFDLLGVSGGQLWWGVVVLVIGAVSSVIGVVYALAEHDIKRLLAYHSCENVGIIALGVGAGIVGWSSNMPLLAALGLMAGLYHLFNHAVFKGLLFLGAGSVMFTTHTKNMEHMGGLARAMPVTAVCFLVGSLAISAIPPLNGFVSEWFTYQSLFNMSVGGGILLPVVGAFCAVSLAITGAFAVMCFVKAYGVTFSGTPRSESARHAREVPVPMLAGMAALAVICVCFGLGAPVIAPAIEGIASSTLNAQALSVANGVEVLNASSGSFVSPPFIAVLLIGSFVLALVVKSALSSGGKAKREDAWACGYLPDEHMPVVATNFASNVNLFFAPFYNIRARLASMGAFFSKAFNTTASASKHTEAVGDNYVIDLIEQVINVVSDKVKAIEGGNFRVYSVYIVIALVLLLALSVLV